MTAGPAVSVIIPCYNQGTFLEHALRSVASATARVHEVIVINDGSTARSTIQALSRLRPMGNHQVLRIQEQANFGLASARNTGLESATADYIQFLDADDMLLDGSLDTQLAMLEASDSRCLVPRADIAIGGYVALDEATLGTTVPDNYWLSLRGLDQHAVAVRWERGLSVPIHCAVFRAALFSDGFGFEDSLPSKEDWLFWVGVLAKAKRIAINYSTVAVYRLHGANMTQTSAARNAYGWMRAVEIGRRRYPEVFSEAVADAAMRHFDSYYWTRLWEQGGHDLPWTMASMLSPGRLGVVAIGPQVR